MSQITIIIVNYQGASDVIECIQSIRVLSSQPQHIVVVDNDSNDGSIEELSQHKENLKFHLIAA